MEAPGIEMPRYQCHKQVWALKIRSVVVQKDADAWLVTPEEPGYAPFSVPHSYVLKHQPAAGGYYVVYDDGYKSFSPAKAFEEGYTRL